MEKLFLGVLLTLYGVFNLTPNRTTKFNLNKVSGGVISIEEMILEIELDDPNNKIDAVEIYTELHELVQGENGCGSYTCSYNVQGLSVGTYEVVVRPIMGTPFSGYVSVE